MMGLLSCFANISNSTLAMKQLVRKTEKIARSYIYILQLFRLQKDQNIYYIIFERSNSCCVVVALQLLLSCLTVLRSCSVVA